VFASLRRTGPAWREIVAGLPDGFQAVRFGGGEVVVGPTGVFALTAAADATEVEVAAHRVVRAATELRELLAQRLSWVPFVDALVVTDAATRSPLAAVVPHRLLDDVITGGRHQLAPAQVDGILAAVRRRPLALA
jgi:hypothetical protein